MMRPFPLVTAHAGCMDTEPNSREHILRALESGADIVELDIRVAADGRAILAHDGAGGEGAAWTLDLDAAFDLIRDENVVVNLDAKEPEAAIVAASVARRRGREESVIFSGLGPVEARLAHERIPRSRYLLNADSLLPASGYSMEEIRLACRLAAEYSCCGLNLEWTSASIELMEYARRRCLPVLLWTVDEEEDLRRAVSLEPYSITTNRPDLLVRLIEARREKGLS